MEDLGVNEANIAASCENSICENERNMKDQVLSKRQLKLQAKKKRWLELKPLRKAKEKEKRKLKIKKAKESGQDLGPSRKMLKSLKMADSSCKLRVCFDLSLADLMTPSEFSKTFKQLHRCYSINRRAAAPLQLYISGYNDNTKCTMEKMSGCFNWDVNFDQKTYSELFDKSEIVYLTSDSPNVLETFDHEKVYIIGALVDHNRLKNICYEKAIEKDVEHARLPLDKFFKFKTRMVLTIDQVYSMILCVTEGRTWIDSVMDVVPKRKGFELIDSSVDKKFDESVECVNRSPEIERTSNSDASCLLTGSFSNNNDNEK